ncbi:MAG: sulfatase-like hydrolase/transferase [Polyangiaceae bacterium]|nr:sulfatase-like hydrolase/transferase [Polyangiaceae bacterium]
MASIRLADRAALIVTASVATGLGFLVADVVRRATGRRPPMWRHLSAALGMYAATAALVALAVVLVTWALEVALRRVERRSPKWALLLAAGSSAALAAHLALPTARFTFSGAQAERFAEHGPTLMVAVIACGALVTHLLFVWSWRRIERGAIKVAVAVGLLGLVLGAGLAYVDLTVYVALYGRLHTLLEVSVAVVWTSSATLLLHAFGRERGRWLRGIAAVAVAWSAAYLTLPSAHGAVDKALRHVWLEPAYVGRVLGRLQTARAYLADPQGWQGAEMSRMVQLRERFDLATTSLSPAWDEPLAEPPAFRQKLERLRGERRDLSIIVYYVDTLRYDVASDPSIMPNVSRLSRESVTFTRAYATGSDTMRSLPAITGGNYEIGGVRENDLLRVAEKNDMTTAVAVAQSAQEFMAKMRPSFSFQEALTVRDYEPNRDDVWGYGADQPTAGKMVDHALDWLKVRRGDRFLLWMFNFDQHNWRELDSAWMHETADRYGVPDEASLNWRYRVVARSVDAEFGRFLAGIDSLGMRDDVIVVFVSDHGEALGRDGFWVHSIFLWESLLRVPLLLRIPGVEPKVVYDEVSLVDLAPTLARYITPTPDTRGYQGEDLLGYLVPGRPPRRLPLLFAGSSHETLLRIGLLRPGLPYKLIVPLETGAPELYDVRDPDPDWVNLADERPAETLSLLSELVRSPLFPRTKDDLKLREQAELSLQPKR